MSFDPIKSSREAPIFVDMPIGLPAAVGFRDCDLEARRNLRNGRNAVFQVPDRGYLQCAGKGWECCSSINERRKKADPDAKGLSQQTCALLPKIKEVDYWLKDNKQGARRIIETHPVVFFVQASGRYMPKKSLREGRRDRVSVLSAVLAEVTDEASIQGWVDKRSKEEGLLMKDAKRDDRVDAFACLASALRHLKGESLELPGGRKRIDDEGLPMRIVV